MNPIVDFYTMAYVAGLIEHPIYKILDMPSQDGKTLTALRFSRLPRVLLLPGDTTAQAFRNELKKRHQKGQAEKIALVIVEDASKIRRKVKEDFFALCTQFSTGIVNIDQQGLDITFRTFASVVINTPPFFSKQLEALLLNAGAGNRFDFVRTSLSSAARAKLDRLGSIYSSHPIQQVMIPHPAELDFLDYLNLFDGKGYSMNKIKCMYACACAGIREDLLESLHNNIIYDIDWDDFWDKKN